jgi:hypothetical protein
MLQAGDAIEVKKIETPSQSIQLNSSHPKDKLRSNYSRLTQACRSAEDWTQKDLIYAIGSVPPGNNQLKSLWLVMGDCYSANSETYTRVEDAITEGVATVGDLDIDINSNELSRINNVDPLGFASCSLVDALK